jgi:hypothetical protein
MSAQGNARPIIKRKKIVKGGGHHGGAWKVAYADFVTAMMAFFMLMWLLGATTEKQRKGIADYFNPTIPINRVSGGGAGAFGGDSVFSEDTLTSGTGTGAGLVTSRSSETQDEAEQALAAVEEALMGLSGESVVRDLIRRHVVTRLSDEGLVIELFDTDSTPLFTRRCPCRSCARSSPPSSPRSRWWRTRLRSIPMWPRPRPRPPPRGRGRWTGARRCAGCSRMRASRRRGSSADRPRRPQAGDDGPCRTPEQPDRDRRAPRRLR